MTSMENCLEYNIVLPGTTDNEVLEWFDFMNSQGNLSSELIRLVSEYIKANNNFITSDLEPQALNSFSKIDQADLFDSLYNCLDSASAMFEEEKKPKKKMLSV